MTSFKENTSLGLLVLRIPLGLVMIMHGWQKLTVWGLEGATMSFAEMGIPLAGLVAPAITFLELVGGLLIILGLATRPLALANAISMIGAIFTVHLGSFYAAEGGYEYVLMLAAASLTLVLTGAGTLSLDRVLTQNLAKKK